jgi:phosphohistidine phosphatase
LIIGHNDGMHLCAQRLVGRAEAADAAKLASGFPTAGLAVIEFAVERWSDLHEGGGRLVGLVFPREMD